MQKGIPVNQPPNLPRKITVDLPFKNKKKTIYLIDGSACIFRAYHAIRNLSNSRGEPTNAVFGFTNILIKMMEDKAPEYAVMFFDMKGPTFRHEMYSDYKANRPPMAEDLVVQLPLIKDVTEGFNLPIVEMQGYEADDLIGTYARLAEAEGFNVVMVTGDKDFMQLVTEKAIIWDPQKDKTFDLEYVREEFQVEPEKIIDIMGFSGDTADNVPGVPGIGPKTAKTLIQTFGSMDGVYEKVETITKKKQKENLINFKEQALISRKLVTIETAAPVTFEADSLKLVPPDRAALAQLFKELEFKRLQDAFPVETDLSQKDYGAVTTMAELEALVENLKAAGIFAVDTETTSLDPFEAKLVGLSFTTEDHQGVYVPCGHDYAGRPDENEIDPPEQVGLAKVLDTLRPVLEDPSIKKVGQNIKYDWMVLINHGIELAGVAFDTMVASYILNPSMRVHGLDQIALDLFDHRTIKYEEVTGKGKKALNFSQVRTEDAVNYACEDSDITFMAYKVLEGKLREVGLHELFETVEMPLVSILMEMELKGIAVDEGRLIDLSKSFEQELETIEATIYSLAGEEFNIRSSQQLGKILFEKLELPIQKKTKKKTGYSTDVEVLTNLSTKHELPAAILRHRTLAKLKSTYTDALTGLINPDTGRIHTSFNQTVTATGRLSSSDPNLQNIPIRTEEGSMIRQAFVPRKGWKLLAADYSQIELRILAHCSNDELLIKAFREGEDIHKRTASEVFETAPFLVTGELRRQAKAINFGIVYGMSSFRLAKELSISQKMAKTYIDNYFKRYSGVRNFIDTTVAEATETGKTGTLLGRVRFLPDITSSNRNVRQGAERIAVNTVIQGTAADLMKLAMIKVDKALKERKLNAAMLLTVHDEIVLEVPPDEEETVAALVKEVMEGVWELSVPLKVNVDLGDNWSEAH